MNINHLSGLQIMQEMCNGNQPIPSMVATIPMSAIEVKLGHVTFLFKANERHLNPMGSIHGGFATTVLDSVTGCAIFSMLKAWCKLYNHRSECQNVLPDSLKY